MENNFAKLDLPYGFTAYKDTDYDSTSGLPLIITSEVDMREMVLVPAGAFLMGTNKRQVEQILQVFSIPLRGTNQVPGTVKLGHDYFRDEMPQHQVWLDAFYIDKYEVTHSAYALFCAATGHSPPSYWDKGKFPDGTQNNAVSHVSWYDACAYANWANKRLPTEAEWEKAARGIDGRWFPWGNQFDARRVNFIRIYDVRLPGAFEVKPEPSEISLRNVDIHPEGQSPYGIMDMVGNVAEWVHDWYDPEYYSRSPHHNPLGPKEGIGRVYKSCSSGQDREKLHCAHRNFDDPANSDWHIGFRCAMSPIINKSSRMG